jgi:hypothetical protein
MITCEEARRVLYDLETTKGGGAQNAEPGSVIALAKAHITVCIACSEYFERERAFIAAMNDRISSLAVPVPQTAVAATLRLIADARSNEFQPPVERRTRSVFSRLRSFFTGSSK